MCMVYVFVMFVQEVVRKDYSVVMCVWFTRQPPKNVQSSYFEAKPFNFWRKVK